MPSDQPAPGPDPAPPAGSAAFLDAMIDALGDPVFVKDEQHRWVVINAAFCRLLGRTRAELLGRSDFEFLPAAEAREFWDKDDLVFRTGEPNRNEEPLTDPQGQVHVLSTKKCRFVDGAGRRFLVGVIRDVTEEKRIQAELVAAKAAAEAAGRARSLFLANVSHEIRTPMNAILGMADLLLSTSLTSEQREHAETIRSSGATLLTLLNDILDLSRAESGRLEVERRPLDPREPLRRAVALLQRKAAEKGLTLTTRVAREVPGRVLGDAVRLEQVLINLLSNAIKFTERGQVELTLEAGPGPETLAWAVRDSGIGIPAGRLDRLFLPFSQVDASTTRQFGGTGLGLAICARLCELMGGRIWVESQEGRGSTFRFALPAPGAQGQVEPRQPPRAMVEDVVAALDPGERASLARLRLLLAEDNPVNRRLTLLMLQRLGLDAEVAVTGVEVLERLREAPRDVVLMDLQMPELDGLEATRRLRRGEAGPHQPWVVALTASALEDRDTCLAAGADDYLPKPISLEALLGALRRAADPGQPRRSTSLP